jgi:hypothetical protein
MVTLEQWVNQGEMEKTETKEMKAHRVRLVRQELLDYLGREVSWDFLD